MFFSNFPSFVLAGPVPSRFFCFFFASDPLETRIAFGIGLFPGFCLESTFFDPNFGLEVLLLIKGLGICFWGSECQRSALNLGMAPFASIRWQGLGNILRAALAALVPLWRWPLAGFTLPGLCRALAVPCQYWQGIGKLTWGLLGIKGP